MKNLYKDYINICDSLTLDDSSSQIIAHIINSELAKRPEACCSLLFLQLLGKISMLRPDSNKLKRLISSTLISQLKKVILDDVTTDPATLQIIRTDIDALRGYKLLLTEWTTGRLT